MTPAEAVLRTLCRRWPSPVAARDAELGAELGTEAYERAYARAQFDRKVQQGLGFTVRDCEVADIGCGHGGGTVFIGLAGARSVIGIDLSEERLAVAQWFKGEVERALAMKGELSVSFRKGDAVALADEWREKFDVIVAENAFEHFEDPALVMRSCAAMLRAGGRLEVPIFSSIFSKYGLHLKYGVKMPWANVLFSERTIVNVLKQLAAEDPSLYEVYPGLRLRDARLARDVRRHRDLNDITYGRFLAMANSAGFDCARFHVQKNILGIFVSRVPVLGRTILRDVLSFGASATLVKR